MQRIHYFQVFHLFTIHIIIFRSYFLNFQDRRNAFVRGFGFHRVELVFDLPRDNFRNSGQIDLGKPSLSIIYLRLNYFIIPLILKIKNTGI